MRVKSCYLSGQGHHFLGNHFGHQAGHQQGYHGARILREEGSTTHRRLTGDDGTDICIEPPQLSVKQNSVSALQNVHSTMDYMTCLFSCLVMISTLIK